MTLSIEYITYDNQIVHATQEEDVPADASFVWYDYSSFEDKDQLLRDFDFTAITLEDEITKLYRPSYYRTDDYQLLICHNIDKETLQAHAINICVMKDIVLTFHNGQLEDFIDIGKIIKNMTEDLEVDIALYILLQAVEQYFGILHDIEDEVIEFEERHGDNKRDPKINAAIFDLKRKVFRVKRVIVPMSELVDKFSEEEEIFNSENSARILKKIKAKIDRQKLIITFSEEMIDEIKENYISYNSYQMNRVINVLTIISAIFLPLTLITGIYGMNFKFMPELNLQFGYFITLGIMLLISIGMLVFFKYKRWM
ncbi:MULTISPECIES: CorA family divalent cation transporter [Jeotgalicoccus]|uniref:CorA family divalent cation transporter n=1 Tax=Jeotgalicoccus TaxID=227979 RepID=UPI0003FD36D2|nr:MULTISPECIES: CorA family divalent cation transporter [Jeotgalicoccus]